MKASPGPTAEAFVMDGLVFPESPRWRDGHLWLSDMHAHRVVRIRDDGATEVYAELTDKPSGIGFLDDGTPIVACMRERRLLRLGSDEPTVHADLRQIHESTFINDMVVGPRGVGFVGSRGRDPIDAPLKEPDWIIRVDARGRPSGAYAGVRRPNGLAITPDGKTLIVAETGAAALTAFDVGDDGALSRRRLFADLEGRSPDGICLDAEGAVWVGCVFAGEFLRVHEGGTVSDRIKLDEGVWAIACILGGPCRQSLFLVCAHETMANALACSDSGTDQRSTARGFVLRAHVDVPGAGWPE